MHWLMSEVMLKLDSRQLLIIVAISPFAVAIASSAAFLTEGAFSVVYNLEISISSRHS